MTFLAPRGMNAYVYAPKDDEKHRRDWRAPYGGEELARFRALAAHGRATGVRVGFAVSPGLDVGYEAAADRAALLTKLHTLQEGGVDWFFLLVDDIPMQDGLGARQAGLAAWLHDALDGAALTLCPTEYVGTRPSRYLADLTANLPPAVDLMWTGPTVCAPTIGAGDARRWVEAVAGRGVVVWDNYPVNDALMTGSMHLGPYRGRDPDLAGIVRGVLCNPMTQARASLVALATAMEFLTAPDSYDPAAAWERALSDVGGTRAPALAVLARACADSPIAAPDTLDLARRVGALGDELEGPGWLEPVGALAGELRAARALPEAFAGTEDPLAHDVGPWAAAAANAARAGLAALRLIQAVRPVAAFGADRGRAAAPAAEAAMHAAFAVLFAWSGARADEKVVYGPRFALYTPVIQLADGSPGLDARAAVREDANAVDALCRLALAAYDDWRTAAAGEPLRVFVDGDERPVAPDGTFDARGDVVLLRQGPCCTRLGRRTRLPFADTRLA
jgi:hyaluronoglucosaminidase